MIQKEEKKKNTYCPSHGTFWGPGPVPFPLLNSLIYSSLPSEWPAIAKARRPGRLQYHVKIPPVIAIQ